MHRITEYWDEGTVSYYSNPASVNYKRMDRIVEGWNVVDITDLYQGWQNGIYPNYGIKLSPNYTNESNGAFVSSDDTVNPDRRPKLVIEYQSLDPSKVKLMVDVQGIGSGQGRVVSKDMKIDCSPICEAILDQSTRVSLSAYPNPGSIFAGWSVTGCGSDKPCAFKLEESRTVTATFIEGPTLYTNNKVIYVGVCGAGDAIENANACHTGFGWYDPRYRPEFDPFNSLIDQDLETVGLAYSGLDAIGLRLAALHPNSVTMITGFSAASVYGDYNPFFIRNNVPSIVDFVSSQYQDGDTVCWRRPKTDHLKGCVPTEN